MSATPQGSKLKYKWMIFALIIIMMIIPIIVYIIKPSKGPQTTPCSEKWIGVRYKCFYFSDDTRNWTASKTFCTSQGSELAQIDTHEDMEFLKTHTGMFTHWIGLSKRQGGSWQWTNGNTFNDWFEVSGNGFFAFLNADGVYSSRGFVDMKWICSKPRF